MNVRVADLLHAKGSVVENIAPTATILDAVKRMSKHRIGCLAVMSDDGELMGVLSERDCMWKVIAEDGAPSKTRVQEAMTPIAAIKTVTPLHTVEDCMELITTGRHRHLLVLNGKNLIGLISIGDVVKCLMDIQVATIQSLEKYINGSL